MRFLSGKICHTNKNSPLRDIFSPFWVCFAIREHIFLMLKAMAKKAKSIVTLSSPTCRNLLYAMLCFICPKTASGSMHRLPLCLTPFSESNLSRACRLYWFNRWLTSIIRFPRALKQLPRKGHPSHLCALYRALSVTYPLAVLSRLIPIRFMCCPIGQT